MKILVIGYSMPWHHSTHLTKWLKDNGHDVEWQNITQFHSEDEGITFCNLNKEYDIVFCFQGDTRIQFEKLSEKTQIVSMNGETYYTLGVMNPDFICVFAPEMIPKFLKFHPEVTRKIWREGKIREFPQPINPSLYDYHAPKTLKGIHFKGPIHTSTADIHLKGMPGNGGGQFRLFREAYTERKEFLEKNKYWIEYHPPSYEGEYAKWISSCEATIIAPAYMSYSDKRRYENMAAGCINIFYVRDQYELKYLQEYGFEHMENCLFVIDNDDLHSILEFYSLNELDKEDIRESAYNLLMKRFTLDVVVPDILKWIESFKIKYFDYNISKEHLDGDGTVPFFKNKKEEEKVNGK